MAELKNDSPVIVGTIAIADTPKTKTGKLRRMAVLKRYRGNGIAERLVKTLVEFCRERQYSKIELITTDIHRTAIKLYTRLGFQCVGYKPYKYLYGLIWVWTYEFELCLESENGA